MSAKHIANSEGHAKCGSYGGRIVQKYTDSDCEHCRMAIDRTIQAMIYLEVESIRQQFPGNKHMLAALMEEVGELARALLEGQGPERVRAEAVQVAAVAHRIAVEGDKLFDDE